jgi:hypothetical protein
VPFHKTEEADIQLDYFQKLTTEPETYYLAKKPCTLCFGKWPCIMKRTAPKCRTCDGEACSFYVPNAVETEARSSKSKRTSQRSDQKQTKPIKSSSSKATSSKRQLSDLSELSELSDVDSSPAEPQKKTKRSSNGLAPAKKAVVVYVEDEESDEEKTSLKNDHKKTKLTRPSSSRVTSSKRQVTELPEISYVDSSPVEPPKTKKSRIESPPVRKEVVYDLEDEESDEEKYEHNSRTCRRLLDRLESQKWYKRLEGKGQCLRDLVEMERLHWKSINGPKGRI